MSKIYAVLSWLIPCFGMAALMLSPRQSMEAAGGGLELCANAIIPSLFPFLVFSSMVVDTGFAKAAGRLFEPVMRPLFKVPGSCSSAFILGLIGGYPVGAKTAIKLYRSGACSKTEAERLLSFCNVSGPAFVLGTVGAGIFGMPSAGRLLFCAQIAAAVITGFVFGRAWRGDTGAFTPRPDPEDRPPLGKAFVGSVKDSAESIINICAFVVFFSVLIGILNTFRVIPAFAEFLGLIFAPAGLDGGFFKPLLSGLFEMTTGVKLSGASDIGFAGRLAVTGAILGWAGLSVHFQVFSFLNKSGLSARPYIYGRIFQSGVSAMLTYCAAIFLPLDVKTSAGAAFYASSGAVTFWAALRSSVAAVLISAALLPAAALAGHLIKGRGK